MPKINGYTRANFAKQNLFGYTLVELLVVIAIISILAVVAFANFKNLKAELAVKKAALELQSYLQVVQTNAISRVICNGESGATWLVGFNTDKKNIDLSCFTDEAATSLQRTLSFDNSPVEIESINGSGSCASSFPAALITISSAPLYGTLTFTDKSPVAFDCFKNSLEVSITLKDSRTLSQKIVIIKKGGVVDVR